MRTSKTIERAIKSHPHKVASYWYEADCSADWWVGFSSGWTYDNQGQHYYNGTATEVAQYIRDGTPCRCAECTQTEDTGRNPIAAKA